MQKPSEASRNTTGKHISHLFDGWLSLQKKNLDSVEKAKITPLNKFYCIFVQNWKRPLIHAFCNQYGQEIRKQQDTSLNEMKVNFMVLEINYYSVCFLWFNILIQQKNCDRKLNGIGKLINHLFAIFNLCKPLINPLEERKSYIMCLLHKIINTSFLIKSVVLFNLEK